VGQPPQSRGLGWDVGKLKVSHLRCTFATVPKDTGVKIDPSLTYPTSFAADIAGMLKTVPGRNYYQLTLGAEKAGSLYCSAYTHWVGWTDETERFELREASLVKGQQAFDQLYYIGQPALIVEGVWHFAVWNAVGGHGLVEKATADEFLPDRIRPSASAYAPEGSGFVGLKSRTELELQYAPTPKVRLRILKRDEFRCRVCGRSPKSNADLELHVHHIRPWGIGGLTHELNLLTLCSTCHRGLPGRKGRDHYDPSLHRLVPGQPSSNRATRAAIAYRDSVLRYRSEVRRRAGGVTD
jgi:hypothetical protein